jgi:hypothetical protein
MQDDTTNEAGGLIELEERAARLERRLARMRGELVEAERGVGAEYDSEPGVRSPNRKPRGTRPDSEAQEPADLRWQGQGGGGVARDNPVRTKVKAATAGAIPGGLLGQYVLSLIEGRYGDLPSELDALIVALVAAAGAFVAGYYKRDRLSPPS